MLGWNIRPMLPDMEKIIRKEKRSNSLLVQFRSKFYVSSLPNLQNRSQRAQNVSISPQTVPPDDEVKSHTFVGRPRSNVVQSENDEDSVPEIEVSDPKEVQKIDKSTSMSESDEEGGRCGERSVSDLRSLFEKKITEANTLKSRSPSSKRPISIDTCTSNRSTSPNPQLSPIRGRVSTAVPPSTQKQDLNCSFRKASYQPPASEKLYNNEVTMGSKDDKNPVLEVSNGHRRASDSSRTKSNISRQESLNNPGTAIPRRPSYPPHNPVQQTVDDTYNVSQSKGSRKGSRASQSRRSTCILPSIDGESRPSLGESVHKERVSNSTFYTAMSPNPARLSDAGKTSSTEDRYYDLNYSPLFRRRSCAADSCFFSFRASSTSSFFSQTSSTAFESTRLKSIDQELSPFPGSEIIEDFNEEDAPEEGHLSVVDLIAKFSGQSEARRQTVLQTSGIRVDLPAKDASKFFLNPNDSSGDTRESQVKVSISQQKENPKMDNTNSDPIVVPEDHGVMTVNVQPVDAGSRRKDGCQTPQAEKNSWVKDKVVIASGVLNGLCDKERKIQESLFEILENEEMYYRSMKYVVIDHFHKKLMHQFPTESHPQFAQPLRTIFKFLGDFAEISDKLLGELERRRGDSPWMVPFFDILIDFVTNVMATPYKRYSVLKQRQEEELNNCRKDQWFCDVLSALNRDPMTGGLTLDAFLILPIQHATRYSLLLETVLKKMEPSDERYGPAQQAYEETRAFAEAINRETDKMEYLFELTTVLAGLKNLPIDNTGKLEKVLHEAKKGNNILMFGREVCFGRTRRGVINFKQTDKLVIFAWSNYVLIAKELNPIGHFSFETLAKNGQALDGLEIFQQLQISSFPKTVDVTKLLLIDFEPIIQGSENANQFLLYCSNATKKKWKQAFDC